jgi:membrane-associated protease RseP (regulator of RpoE activity)
MTEITDNLIPKLVEATKSVMTVEDVTAGVPPGDSVRFRGRLLAPAHEAWAYLAEQMTPLGRTPLLRRDSRGTGEEVLALPMTFARAKPRVRLALLLFGLTVLSCLFVGAQMVEGLQALNLNLLDGLPFAASLLAILAAHEFGHYLTARHLGSSTSLPYFIPMPFGPFGTFGAFISMAVPPRNRRHLLAIAAAGPLAGLILAVPILWVGLGLSHIQPIPPAGYQMEGNSLLYVALKYLKFGRLLPAAGVDVFIHPVAFAAWAGLLVTGLNLIPAGQLDGGHIAYALLGRKGAAILTWVVLALLAGLSFLWTGWVLWLVLIFAFSRIQDMPLDDITDLTSRQRILAAAMLVLFLLVFTPIPLTIVP